MGKVLAGVDVGVGVVTFVTVATHVTHAAVDAGVLLVQAASSNAMMATSPFAILFLDLSATSALLGRALEVPATSDSNILIASNEAMAKAR